MRHSHRLWYRLCGFRRRYDQLIVLSAFFGMELKTAVGTSTFIMAFTALIASVSHIMIHPAIFFEKWDVMLLCIVVDTTASLVSARSAG